MKFKPFSKSRLQIYYHALEYRTNSTKELFVEEADMMKMLESELRAQDNSQWSTCCS